MTATKEKTKQQKETFTREEVEKLLKQQVAACADRIEGAMTEYCAKKTVLETKLVEF